MREKILVADDDADNRRIVELVLRRAGFEVVAAVDGRQALEAARRESPGVIVLDVSMPVLSGWDAVRLLKSDESLRRVPVLAFTAHAMSGDERRTLEAGFDGYLSKPCAPRRLLEAVEAALKKAAQGAPR